MIDGMKKEILGISDLLLGKEIAARGGAGDKELEVICYGLLGGKSKIEHRNGRMEMNVGF